MSGFDGYSNQSYGYGNKPQKQRFNDEDAERKVFVGGISLDTTDSDLYGYFSQFGEVKNVQIKYDAATGRSRGFAFIEFGTVDSCRSALQSRVHEIKSKRCEVKKATSREYKKVFVGGISPDITTEEVQSYFVKYGEVDDVEFPIDKATNRRRNFCFVIFKDEPGAQAAIEQRKHMIGDKYCDVKLFQPNPPKQQDALGVGAGGGYGYGYGYGGAADGYGGGAQAAAQNYGAAAQAYANGGQYSPEYANYWQQYWQYYGQAYASQAQQQMYGSQPSAAQQPHGAAQNAYAQYYQQQHYGRKE